MRIRYRNGLSYYNFRWKGKKKEGALRENNNPNGRTLFEHETRKQQIAIGRILADLESGVDIVSARGKISNMEYPETDERGIMVWRLHIKPFFGQYKIPEVTRKLIEAYIAFRYPEKMPSESTVNKEVRVLRLVIQKVNPSWVLPKFSYQVRDKNRLAPLSFEIMKATAKLLQGNNKAMFWIMAHTGMEPKDVGQLAPCHFQDGFIIKTRSKTSHLKNSPKIKVPIVPALQKVLDSIPRPLDDKQPYFPDLDNTLLSERVRNAFAKAGYPGYGSKYLRRYVPTMLFKAGFKKEWIRLAIGHTQDSQNTDVYIDISDDELKQAFKEAF